MIQSKVDSRFLGTVQDTFHGLPPLPGPVQTFLMFLGASLLFVLIVYWFKSYGFGKIVKSLLKKTSFDLKSGSVEKKTGKSKAFKIAVRSGNGGPWKVSSDQDILDKLVMSKAQIDVLVERSGQRSLAAVVNAAGVEKLDVVATFDDLVSDELLNPGTQVKCIFPEMIRGEKKVNAFVGLIASKSSDKGMIITRRSSFGFIKRRVFARRKVADQRYIKIKIWRLETEDYDVDFILDNIKADVLIDNRKFKTPNPSVPQVLDISKGGIALTATFREGGNVISRNDKVILCMLIYQPSHKTFQPHLIYAESRAARAMGRGMTRLSFQFLRSLQVPPRKRSTLFKGQAVMAMSLAHPERK